jgi:hypothetical protein
MKEQNPRARPRVLAMGREATANAIKMIAQANTATREATGGEFCALPSIHVEKNRGKDGKDLVSTRFDLFAV